MKIADKFYRLVSLILVVITLLFVISQGVAIVVRQVYLNDYSRDANNYTSEQVNDIISNSTGELSQTIANNALMHVKEIIGGLENVVGATEQMVLTLGQIPPNPSQEVGRQEVDRRHMLRMENSNKAENEVDEQKYAMLGGFLVNQLATEQMKIDNVFFMTSTGLLISNAHHTDQMELDGDLRERNWYTAALKSNDYVISEVYTSASSLAKDTITCSKAVRYEGAVIGVIGADLEISQLRRGIFQDVKNALLVNQSTGDVYNISADEELVAFSNQNRELILELSDSPSKDGFALEKMYDKTVMVSKIDNAPWILVIYFDLSNIEQSLNDISSTLSTHRDELQNNMATFSIGIFVLSLLFILIVIFIALRVSRRTSNALTRPINSLAEKIKLVGNGHFETDFSVYSSEGAEIATIAESTAQMSKDLQKYTTKLSENAKLQQRLESELTIARAVQGDLLLDVILPESVSRQIDLSAVMVPAKQVGGDFYDYAFIDNEESGEVEKVVVIIADVSDKGIAAALFMSNTINTIRRHLMAQIEKGASAGEILTLVNSELVGHNKSMMFATCYLAIFDINTGEVQSANAGHSTPLVTTTSEGGVIVEEFYQAEFSPPLAIRRNIEYKTWRYQLGENQGLLLYTDGVTDAKSASGEYYGLERVRKQLEMIARVSISAEMVTASLLSNVQAFASSAEQFDDITMLMLWRRKAPEISSVVVNLNEECSNLSKSTALGVIQQYLKKLVDGGRINSQRMQEIRIATEELVTNIVDYSNAKQLTLHFGESVLTIEDDGVEFNPLDASTPDLDEETSKRIPGGLGIFLARKYIKQMNYRRFENANLLELPIDQNC